MENKQTDVDSNAKIIAQIVGYLKNYPFLLMAVLLMLLMFAFLAGADVDTIRELKPLIYGLLVLEAVLCGLQFFFEFRKQQGGGVAKPVTLVKKADEVSDVHFSRKAIASLILIAINVLAFGGALDKDAHLGAIVVLGIPALLLGYSALNDTLHGAARGRGWAVVASAFSVLMILASLGGMSQDAEPNAAHDSPAPVNTETQTEPQPDVLQYPPAVPEKQMSAPAQRSGSLPQQTIASECVTQYGSCPMMIALPVGSGCTCTSEYGIFPGLAQ
ncbi:MAG: hypothetical protein Q7U37_09060 [Gallionella sp.]|nr:hypothetical protein [Gallionella sp.]